MLPEAGTIIITIDGPAGAGKSTVAQGLAKRLGFAFLDTGAMYRALTLKAMRLKVDLHSEEQLTAIAIDTKIDLIPSETGLIILLDGKDVSEDIRSQEVTNNTFQIASKGKVRDVAVSWQREFGCKQNTVVEGRDVGSVVFPKANFKFYLDANPSERAQRRADELRNKGVNFDVAVLTQEIKDRDHKDMTRDVSPLVKPENAIIYDTTGMVVDEVVSALEVLIKEKS